ncbi:TauD/TfdA dioxygenase family protein [Altericroceibacterium endophyticum]|uniref:TauD/TfdA family dioxygenase n=1 Tax=Altericroceibacterium endophyticum TaxID=1808508 RepID=A0A6I4T3A2_9SPHN|nr:TauD/TfdA family dioxygenase [Altericroceibacterium endophyticum]MXO65397.1 TauD/TfdA family dioxygenase [Altericroceibacterium endophyticum]
MKESRISPAGDFDNSARQYDHITALPAASSLGAEIKGPRLTDLDDAGFAEFRDALHRHKMLFIRGQDLTHEEHESFAARLGPFAVDAYTQGTAGHRNVHPIIKEADQKSKALFGSGWHTDSPFLAEPPSITMLRAVEIPPYGGDTVWANTALAFRFLSPVMQDMLRPLKVHMSASANYATQAKVSGKAIPFADDQQKQEALEGRFHPLVRTHPETGEEALYVDEVYAVGIEGMTSDESTPLLDFLRRHITTHAFTFRLRWEPGMIALWDNRATLHLAANDYDGYRREMYRTTTAGTAPE